jgi:hypothetical protein
LLDLRAFVKPDEVEIFAAFLLLLDLDCPQPFNTLCLVSSWGVVMPFMGIDFRYSESEEGQREELEGVLEGGTVGDFGEEGILLAGFGVCWRFKRSECTLD